MRRIIPLPEKLREILQLQDGANLEHLSQRSKRHFSRSKNGAISVSLVRNLALIY
jgi:hypothetical protein